jgi:hypothetical protein
MVAAMACLRATIYKIPIPANSRSEAVIIKFFMEYFL